MPIGYLVTTGGIAAVSWSAVLRHRPRRSSPFRLSYAFGLWLNWPLVTFLLLVASTVLAVDQSGVGSPGLWIGFGLSVVASAGLVVLRRRARRTGPVLQQALDEGLGTEWSERVDADLAARLRRRPSLARVLFEPISSRRRVTRIANIRYGPARRANLLDLYRDRSDRSARPVLIHLHPVFGSKRLGTRYLFHRLACEGWICVGANYRRSSDDAYSAPLTDVKKVIAWVREHGPEHGADADAIFVGGSSLGGGLAALAALTPGDPALQPGFENADTTVAGVISLYGYYGPVAGRGATTRSSYATSNAPPCFVAHGDQDSLVVVEDARRFVEQLRATSSSPVVYAELPGAQHGFDLFRSRRLHTVVDAVEAFAAWVRSGRGGRSGERVSSTIGDGSAAPDARAGSTGAAFAP